MKQQNQKWEVKFSSDAQRELDNLPDEVYEELTKLIQGFKEGKLDPAEMGQPVNFVEIKEKLLCPECRSANVEWLLDKNSDEIDFFCLDCSKSFWMAYEDYKKAVKRNPDKVIV